MLKISESLILLAQNPNKKTSYISGLYAYYGLVGALLFEMADLELIEIREDYLLVNSRKTTENPAYNEILDRIKNSSKSRKADYWYRYLAQKSKSLQKHVFSSMEDQRLIKVHRLKFLGIPYRKIELKAKGERIHLISDLKNALLNFQDIQNKQAALLALVLAFHLQGNFHKSREESKKFTKRLKERISGLSKEKASMNSFDQIQQLILKSVLTTVNPGYMG